MAGRCICAFDYHGRLWSPHPLLAPRRVLGRLWWVACSALGLLLGPAASLYHWVFVKGAREGWPVFGALVKLVAKDEFDERDKFMRANLDAMAKRVGEMQARMVQLESLGERVMGLAGLPASEVPKADGRGGALVGARNLSLRRVAATLDDLERVAGQRSDWMTVAESRLF